MVNNGGFIGRAGSDRQQHGRNRGTIAACALIVAGILPLLRYVVYSFWTIFSSGFALFVGYLAGWRINELLTYGTSILLVVIAAFILFGRTHWLWAGALLLIADLLFMILFMVMYGSFYFINTSEILLSFVWRGVILWLVLRDALALGRFEKYQVEGFAATAVPQAEQWQAQSPAPAPFEAHKAEPLFDARANVAAAPPQPMFCPNCGEKLGSGSRFCENCGTPVA